MRAARTIMAVAAVLVVALSGVALGANGDPITAGQSSTATKQTTLTATVSGTAAGLKVVSNGTTTGPALSGVSSGPSVGVAGSTGDASSYGGRFVNNATTHGSGSAGLFIGNHDTGVIGLSNDFLSSGVYGEATSGHGITGRATTGNGVGVFGENTAAGLAGWFVGGVVVNGSVSISGGMSLGGPLECPGCPKTKGQAVPISPGVTMNLGDPLLGFLQLSYACPSNLANNGTLVIRNVSGNVGNIFVESGDPNPLYFQLNGNGGEVPLGAAATGDSFHIQAQGYLGVMTIEAATVNRASDCHAQAQAILTPL